MITGRTVVAFAAGIGLFAALIGGGAALAQQANVSSRWVTDEMASDLVPVAEYGVVIPRGCSAAKRCPMILLLHGGGGNREYGRSMQPALERLWSAGDLPLAVVVSPGAGRSFYMDFKDGSQRWETWIVRELIPHIRREYPVLPGREATVVTGVSMGGMGSLRLAFKHPDVFSAVAALEPAIEAGARWSQLNELDRFYRRGGVVEEKFGDPVDETYWAANHPIAIALADTRGLAASGLAIYFEVGERDMLYLHRGAEYLHRVLYDRGVSHEFRYVRGGDHVGPSLGPRWLDALRFLGKALRGDAGDPRVSLGALDAAKESSASAFARPRALPPLPINVETSSGMDNLLVTRFETNPLVKPFAGPGIETNVNGPAVIRVPAWLPNPLGQYYLYFADHKGNSIRLAYADDVRGPWTIHGPGSLQLADSHFLTATAEITAADQALIDAGRFAPHDREGVPQPIDSATKPHIASPDVQVRHDRQEIVLYYHGLESFRRQMTRVATSNDGVNFVAREPLIARPYLRAFQHDEQWYAMSMPGIFYRSADGLSGFEQGPQLFPNEMRHAALLKRGDTLYVFWTRVGDTPEHILLSSIDVSGDWQTWKASPPVSVLAPERAYEGADRPLAPSVRDAINVRVNQLRDPAILEDDGKTYLFYAIAGEAGIAGAEIEF